MMLILMMACATTVDSGDDVAGDVPTWEVEVSPIVGRACVGCHHPGGVGQGDFTTFAGASAYAVAMKAATDAGRMPPAAMDATCRPYVGHERLAISDDEVAAIAAWADGGAPEGAAIAALVPPELTLAGADVEATVPIAHSVTPGDDGNEYHCQVLVNPFTETTYITGFDVIVDEASVVHHTLLAVDGGADAGAASGDADLTDGWDCRTPIAENDWNILHAWAPGMEPTAFPEGGMKVEPGDQIVLQMHYFADEAGTIDQSGYRFRTAASADPEIFMAPLGPTGFRVADGEVEAVQEDYVNDYGVDITVHGVFPHMHLYGVGYQSAVVDGGTETCLARDDDWDFGHQMTYLYEEPAIWGQGATLTTSCTYDNTSGDTLTYGEGTNQEMCFFLFYYST